MFFSLQQRCTVRSESRCALTVRRFGCQCRPRTLSELKTAIPAYIRNISQEDLQQVFANKIKRVQACIRRSWTSLPTPFTRAQRFSERTVENTRPVLFPNCERPSLKPI